MQRYAVGEPYDPKNPRRRYDDGFHFSFSDTGIMLVGFMAGPKPAEIQDFKSGVAQFALVDGESCAVLCFRFGTQPWSDAPWEAWRLPAGYRLPEQGANLITIVLVDGDTGIVKVVRTIGWKPDFAAAAHRVFSRLVAGPASPEAATADLNRLFALPTAELVKQAVARD
ncbi:hypothetical protein [Actinomadura violacea]|uniref:Uncharacterized protein n=1 Tax=Actinomadura violacea TaxID=2819934 RepID=A0ABS3RXT4_9ACTN|nr:hypothetical protein [Actinomadura violacea]MBO2461563.1 hypothetical protein [Actinomadura violacea]